MHGILEIINLGKYLLMNNYVMDIHHNRAFNNRAKGHLKANKGHRMTTLELLPQATFHTWV
jgi:hypothetical protein